MSSWITICSQRIWIVTILFTLAACAQEERPQENIDQVNLQLKWIHQAQFAGFYLAHEKGYYADENIQINFLEGGKDVDVLTSLVSGKADFAVASSEMVLMQRQKEAAPITAIAAIYRRSAVVYLSMADTGISGPADFIGKTAAVLAKSQSHGEFEYQFKALMEKRGVDIGRIKLVPYDPTYKGFYSGDVDITAAYYTSGALRIRSSGHTINLVWPNDYGIHFYSDTLITTEEIIEKKPDLAERFLRASLKGWREAVGYPDIAVDITLKFAKTKDRSWQAGMLSALTPLVHTGKDDIGWMQEDVWEQMHQVMVDQKILKVPLKDLRPVYTLQFLKAVYSPKPR